VEANLPEGRQVKIISGATDEHVKQCWLWTLSGFNIYFQHFYQMLSSGVI